jgi:hypothetical protein
MILPQVFAWVKDADKAHRISGISEFRSIRKVITFSLLGTVAFVVTRNLYFVAPPLTIAILSVGDLATLKYTFALMRRLATKARLGDSFARMRLIMITTDFARTRAGPQPKAEAKELLFLAMSDASYLQGSLFQDIELSDNISEQEPLVR